jgi:Zn-dependent protease with chaperone function
MAGFISLFVFSTALLVSASLTLAPTFVLGATIALNGWTHEDPEFAAVALPIMLVGLKAFAVLAPVLLVLLGGYCLLAIRGSRDRVAGALEAIPVSTGDDRFALTRSALADAMAVTGAESEPRLYALPEARSAINACAFGRSRQSAGIAVTFGFAENLPEAEQRALMAAMLMRIASGDTARVTSFISVMIPLIKLRDAENPFYNRITWLIAVVWDALALSARLLMTLQARGAWLGFEKADGEAMLALRDPVAMLKALDTLACSDTFVPAHDVFGGLFITALNGDPRVTTDEAERLRRMREVLGAEGAVFRPESTRPARSTV